MATTSQPRSLLSMAKLNRARSRIRPSASNRVLIDQTCFGRSGGLAPIILPLFQGMRFLGSGPFAMSDMIVLLCYEDGENAPPPKKVGKDFGFQGGCGHRDALAANWDNPNVPLLPRVGHGAALDRRPFSVSG